MTESIFTPKSRILVAPMDWGLGHATRCIPLIRYLLQQGCDVWLAGEGNIAALLRTEFPALPLLALPGYNIHYGRSKWDLLGKMALQIPKILSRIEQENEWLQGAVAEHGFDGVISDNRFGLYHEASYSVFMTHQLLIKAPFGSFGEGMMQRLNYDLIEQFDECWVPDTPGQPSLAGMLSHPEKLPTLPTTYIGPLSRFHRSATEVSPKHLLVVLSGPEPQRTILEELLLEQLKAYEGPVLVVRALPGGSEESVVTDNLTIVNHLDANALEKAMQEASLVISRCGYSTVMDLVALGKRSILIPTPGQTEQEYLAAHLMEQGLALCAAQDEFELLPLLQLAESFPYQTTAFDTQGLMQGAVDQMLAKVRERKLAVRPDAAHNSSIVSNE
jgi:UDP-N-acetylglucosamine transferase subunit ALG13